MSTVVRFPLEKIEYQTLPRQRVFYLGYRYIGPMFCQELQHLYLKRKGTVNGIRWWAMITYGKYDDFDVRNYSLQLEECEEDAVLSLLQMFDMYHVVSLEQLRGMGWRGCTAEILEFTPQT